MTRRRWMMSPISVPKNPMIHAITNTMARIYIVLFIAKSLDEVYLKLRHMIKVDPRAGKCFTQFELRVTSFTCFLKCYHDYSKFLSSSNNSSKWTVAWLEAYPDIYYLSTRKSTITDRRSDRNHVVSFAITEA